MYLSLRLIMTPSHFNIARSVQVAVGDGVFPPAHPLGLIAPATAENIANAQAVRYEIPDYMRRLVNFSPLQPGHPVMFPCTWKQWNENMGQWDVVPRPLNPNTGCAITIFACIRYIHSQLDRT